MGAVYRATDVRLRRDVALKVLPSTTGSDPQRQLRLLEEARAAGALAHPNILTVHDFGIEGSTPYLVAEFVEGRRLRDDVARGPLPVKQLVDVAAQLAAGLAAAHARDMAHLDLKPENVMIGRDGRVRIVDFGLARFLQAPSTVVAMHDGAPQDETVSLAGTAPYLSPEQASGKTGDFRSDQFALGVMLYEMATGVHPLRRSTTAETLAAIVGEEAPPVAQHRPHLPVALRWIIERCLAKDPASRYASTTDLARDLSTLRERLPEALEGQQVVRPGAGRRGLVVMSAVAVAAVALVIAAFVLSASAPQMLSSPSPLITYTTFQSTPSWSPDGKTLAYAAQVDGVLQVFTRGLSSSGPDPLTASPFDCTDPFWSPDGSTIYYHRLAGADESLWSVPAAGGPTKRVVQNASRGTVSRDGRFVFAREIDGVRQALWTAAVTGTDERPFQRGVFATGTFNGGYFRFSPDGSKLLVWTYWTPPSGVSVSKLWLIPWPEGDPQEVLPSLGGRGLGGVAFDWLPDSRRVVIAASDQRSSSTSTHLWLADIEADTLHQLTSTTGSEHWPSVTGTGEGARLAFTSGTVDFNLLEIPVDGRAPSEVLATSRSELDPAWSPKNQHYAFVSDRSGPVEIILRSPDGTVERTIVSGGHFGAPTRTLGSLAFSPDGRQLAYQRLGDDSGYRIWISSVTGSSPVQLSAGTGYQDAPTWSPDGTQIAFTTTPVGSTDLAVATVGAGTDPKVIRKGITPYSRPSWSPKDQWILCETPEGLLLVSPDGLRSRLISEDEWLAVTWNHDGTLVYGFKETDKPRHFMLVELNIRSGVERVINPDLGVIPPVNQPIRGLSRIGRTSLITSVARARSDIWWYERFSPPAAGWWSLVKSRLIGSE